MVGSTIESNLDAISVAPRVQTADLLQHVYRPECRILHYDALTEQPDLSSPGLIALLRSIASFEDRCRAEGINLDAEDLATAQGREAKSAHQALLIFRRKTIHLNEQLGKWAADYFVLETIQCLRKKLTTMPEIEMDIKNSTQGLLLRLFDDAGVEAACHSTSLDATDCVSAKVKHLADYLLEPIQEELCGIVFVTQRVVTSVLSVLLSLHPAVNTKIRCMPFVGTSNASSRKFAITELVDLRLQKKTLEGFRARETNLIIATSVLEEGIDVQACNVVACFDPPTNLKAFIQRRGRARHKRSRLAVMVPAGDESGIIQKFMALEEELNAICQSDRKHVERHQRVFEEDMDYVLSAPTTG